MHVRSKYWITYIVPDCWQWHENDFSFLCSLTHSYHIGRPSRLQVQRRKIRLLVAIYHGCQAKLITSIFNRIQNYIYSPKLSFFFSKETVILFVANENGHHIWPADRSEWTTASWLHFRRPLQGCVARRHIFCPRLHACCCASMANHSILSWRTYIRPILQIWFPFGAVQAT